MSQAVVESRIPFSAMWSPSFVPKPEDWPEQCRVVGTFTTTKSKPVDVEALDQEHPEFMKWYQSRPDKPIFLGFGSMVIKDTAHLSKIIMEAAKASQRRVVVHTLQCLSVGDVDIDIRH